MRAGSICPSVWEKEAGVSQRGNRKPQAASSAKSQLVDAFAQGLPFPLDPFQREAALHLAGGRSVLVAAPTGTGKTVVAEFAIWLVRRAGQRAIYTAPLKALSNQKYRDLRTAYGAEQVGLMTGDIVENPLAPIVVMTTEIYRNMLLEGSRAGAADASPAPPTLTYGQDLARRAQLDEGLSSVGCVVFDELHYLSDVERGPVWEEAIIHSPGHVTFVGLSATVSNADQLRAWMEQVHGPTALVLHVQRAVPLEHYYFLDGKLHLVRDAEGHRVERFPNTGGEAKRARERNRPRAFVFGDDEPPNRFAALRGQDGSGGSGTTTSAPRDGRRRGDNGREQRGSDARRARAEGRASDAVMSRGQGTRRTADKTDKADMPAHGTAGTDDEAPIRRQAPDAGEVLTALRKDGLLPCLYFLPGRRAVEVAAESAAGHVLVSAEQRARLHVEVQAWVRALPAEDQKMNQVRRLATLLPRGLAFHHAGLLPGLKVMVETLFARGDLRAVFATDTLALGINMPARSVALGSLSKFDGVSMRLLTPNEYQQLTGRAGRRGMDERGAAIIPYSPWDEFEPAFALLTGEMLPVISAFSIRYNTILNLWRPHDLARLRAAVAASLREFQRRGSDVGARPPTGHHRARARRKQEETGLSRAAHQELNATVWTLRHLGYIGGEDELTIRGHLLRAIFHPAGMVLTEMMLSGAFEELGPAEVAEVVSWFTFDDDRSLRNRYTLGRRLVEARRAVYHALRIVQGAEYAEGVALSPGVADTFYGLALNWWRGSSLGGLARNVDLAEGDLLVSLNQTIDLLQQLQAAVGQALDTRDLWSTPGAKPQATRADGRGGAASGSRRAIETARNRLAELRPTLDAAWRGLLRGSVAQSRMIPSISTPAAGTQGAAATETELVTPGTVPLPLAEDEDPAGARQDRVEDEGVPDTDRMPE